MRHRMSRIAGLLALAALLAAAPGPGGAPEDRQDVVAQAAPPVAQLAGLAYTLDLSAPTLAAALLVASDAPAQEAQPVAREVHLEAATSFVDGSSPPHQLAGSVVRDSSSRRPTSNGRRAGPDFAADLRVSDRRV